VAVNSMVEKERIALVMDELVRVGAEDVLVLGIENTRMGRFVGASMGGVGEGGGKE